MRLGGYGGRRPSQLSGGQRQRVALARALVNRPKVLLLDEPLGALDLKLRREMQIELKQLQREVGITFVFVTHDQEEALTMSDRIAVFNEGRIEQVAHAGGALRGPASSFVAGFVGTSNLIEGETARAVLGREGMYSIRPEKIHLAGTDERGRPARSSRPAWSRRSSTSARSTTTSSTSTRAARLTVAAAEPARDLRPRVSGGRPGHLGLAPSEHLIDLTRRPATNVDSTDRRDPTRRKHEHDAPLPERRSRSRCRLAGRLRHRRRERGPRRRPDRRGAGRFTPPDVPMADELGDRRGPVNVLAWPGYAEDGCTDKRSTGSRRSRRRPAARSTSKFFGTSDETVTLMKTGQYDVVSASGDATLRMIAAGDVAPVNTDLIPNYADDVRTSSRTAPWNSVNGQMYGIPHGCGANLLMYNTDKVKPAPTSWGAVFDDAATTSGKVTAYDSPIYIADAALYLMKTQPDLGIKDPYALDADQLAAAVDLLKAAARARRRVLVGLPQGVQAFKTGDTVIGTTWQVIANVARPRRRRSRRSCPRRARPAGRTPG